uniref:Uncharacterized protein n=1 Tax=Timema cristinae TaxID=61476 RepID=A0A7R9H499_TIMCR|nr:unnamed protein product [Timema cristinae]
MGKERIPTFAWRKNGKSFWKTTFSTPDRDLNLDLPVIGSIIYCESSALDYAATEVGDLPTFAWKESVKPFRENYPQYSDRPVISRPVQQEGNALDDSATEVARKQELAARGSSPVAERMSWGGIVRVCLRCCQVKIGKDASVGMTTLASHVTTPRKKLGPPDGGWGWIGGGWSCDH